jgi:hypothetical protein
MRATWLDSVTSLLLAIIIMLGCVVGALLVVWLVDDRETEIKLTRPVVRGMVTKSGVEIEPSFDVPKKSEFVILPDDAPRYDAPR